MRYPIRNIVYEKIKQSNTLTDSELSSLLSKEGIELDIAEINKILLDLRNIWAFEGLMDLER